MKSALVIGSDGTIGKALATYLRPSWRVHETTRRDRPSGIRYDLTKQPPEFPPVDVVYFCAAVAKFVDCETNPETYRINVDAPLAVARSMKRGLFVFLSSDAVEKALHTNYGMHKALAEIGLLALPHAAVVRLARVTPDQLPRLCDHLASIQSPGLHRYA